MELKLFIQKTLDEIINGVHSVREVSPYDLYFTHDTDNRTISFDIAVTAENNMQGGGSAKINVLGLGIGADAETLTKSSSVSRIKFGLKVEGTTKQEKRIEKEYRDSRSVVLDYN